MAGALGDLADRDVHGRAAEAKPSRQGGDEDESIEGKEQQLENRVECDEPRAIVGIAAGQIVPNYYHRDAAGEPDQNQPSHELGTIAQKNNGQSKHEDRADDPVLHQRKDEYSPVAKYVSQFVVVRLSPVADTSSGSGRVQAGSMWSRPSCDRKVPCIPGNIAPSATPSAIARKIHEVR